MQVAGLNRQDFYFQNRYRDAQRTQNRNAVNPVSPLSEKKASTDALTLSSSAKTDEFGGILALQYKKECIDSYEKELEEARLNDYEKYTQMVNQRAGENANTFDQVVQLVKNGQNTTAYQNVSVNTDDKKMSIGGMQGHIITVGLSNGWALEFSREDIDQVAGMIDIFSPEDVRRIMEAITKDSMVQSTQDEMEEDKASLGKIAEKAEETQKTVAGDTKKSEAATEATEETEEAEEESEVTSQVVVNADGSRHLVITTQIGDMEVMTKVSLSPSKPDEKFQEEIKPVDFKMLNAASSYESTFMYA